MECTEIRETGTTLRLKIREVCGPRVACLTERCYLMQRIHQFWGDFLGQLHLFGVYTLQLAVRPCTSGE